MGFIDDNPVFIGRKVDRLPVVGSGKELASIFAKWQINALILSADSIDVDRLSEVISLCHQHQISLLRCNLSIEPISDKAILNGDKEYGLAAGL